MKKLLFLALIALLCLSISACDSGGNDIETTAAEYETLNLTFDEVEGIKKDLEDSVFEYCGYAFFIYQNNSVVVHYNGDYTEIKEIRSFDIKNVSSSVFAEIVSGMTVFDVVELVGLPFQSTTFGICSMDFKSADEKIFHIVWDNDMKVESVKQAT